jgi:hypothetical protein
MTPPFIEPPDNPIDEEENDNKLSLGAMLLLLLLIAAMLTSLAWPIVWQIIYHYNAPPTPTPLYLQEA